MRTDEAALRNRADTLNDIVECNHSRIESSRERVAPGPGLRPTIYPIFLPHAGCPFQCVYCNQHVVTASLLEENRSWNEFKAQAKASVQAMAEEACRKNRAGEVAFYGGTFTALPVGVLHELLRFAALHVAAGVFTGIRFSTRPDGLTPTTGDLLADYPIQTVELGVQSLSDAVLTASWRGYTAQRVEAAAALVKEHGWALGIQLMLGLPGDSRRQFLESVEKVIELKPDFIRIYPTLILKGTLLADWYQGGMYQPLGLDEAIDWCVAAYDASVKADIAVARMGLQADPELDRPGHVLAGPYHPAFGYWVRVHWWRSRVDQAFQDHPGVKPGASVMLRAPDRQVSEVVGPRRANLVHWQNRWGLKSVTVQGEAGRPSGRFEIVEQGS